MLGGPLDERANASIFTGCVEEELQAPHHQMRAVVFKGCLVVLGHGSCEDQALPRNGQTLQSLRSEGGKLPDLIFGGKGKQFEEFLRTADLAQVEATFTMEGVVDELDHGLESFSGGLLHLHHL